MCYNLRIAFKGKIKGNLTIPFLKMAEACFNKFQNQTLASLFLSDRHDLEDHEWSVVQHRI
ncbi:MAG: hypothetical protein JWM44_2092 [Bacilli bacterium]|nr:hypothetical protein [Bacilli bacterium]